MPEGYTHVRTAQKAAHAIHYKLQCPAAFAAGANGPDSFFCYEVWKKGQNRTYNLPLLGNRMHEDKTGAFLLALLHHTHTQAQIEYTLGFLCHYGADTVMHPYVVFVSSPADFRKDSFASFGAKRRLSAREISALISSGPYSSRKYFTAARTRMMSSVW